MKRPDRNNQFKHFLDLLLEKIKAGNIRSPLFIFYCLYNYILLHFDFRETKSNQ